MVGTAQAKHKGKNELSQNCHTLHFLGRNPLFIGGGLNFATRRSLVEQTMLDWETHLNPLSAELEGPVESNATPGIRWKRPMKPAACRSLSACQNLPGQCLAWMDMRKLRHIQALPSLFEAVRESSCLNPLFIEGDAHDLPKSPPYLLKQYGQGAFIL